jgi:hypothetical protein
MPAGNPAGVIYGVIVIGALLAAESGNHETYLETVGSAAIAAGLYWLAHAYTTVLGRRLQNHERLTAVALWRALVHDWALIRGAAIPLLVLLVAWATGAAQATAVTAALWSAVASLVGFELLAAMGLAVLALKIVLH